MLELLYLVPPLHLLDLAQLFRAQHALDALHVPHQQTLRLQELVVGALPGVLQLVVLLPLELQHVTHCVRTYNLILADIHLAILENKSCGIVLWIFFFFFFLFVNEDVMFRSLLDHNPFGTI